jgi:hypothetical protein
LTRKPGASFTGSGSLSILRTKAAALLRRFGRGALAGHHLDQRHHRHRIEEVDADQARRILERRRNVGQFEAGGVGGDQRLGFGARFDVGEQGLLGVEVFEDRLDDHVGLAHAIPFGVGDQAVEGEAGGFPVAQLLFEELRGAADGRRDAFHRLVLQRDGHAAQHAPGGDVAAHDAGADHMHALRRKVPRILAEALQSVLQEEDAHQVARGRVLHQRVERGGPVGGHGQGIAAVVLPLIDDGVRRRVVLLACALRHLLPGTVGDQRFQRAIQQLLQEGQRARRLAGEHQHARGVFHDARRHAFVGEAHLLCAFGIDVLAGQHHVHRRRRADDLRQAQHAAPAGNDAEHDFGQGELGAGLIHGDAVAAGQRQLGAAAHAVAAHQRQRRVAHRRQAVVGVPAALDEARAFSGVSLRKRIPRCWRRR